MRRVRSADPEGAELATVAITAMVVLEMYWRHDEECPLVADFWTRVRMAVESRPVADLETALNAARGLRDVRRIFPFTFKEADEAADRIERRAWERERARLGIKPKVATDAR